MIDRKTLCLFGLHAWSKNKGGIKICKRDGCGEAKTFGITGHMRRKDWNDQLYEKYQEYNSQDE